MTTADQLRFILDFLIDTQFDFKEMIKKRASELIQHINTAAIPFKSRDELLRDLRETTLYVDSHRWLDQLIGRVMNDLIEELRREAWDND